MLGNLEVWLFLSVLALGISVTIKSRFIQIRRLPIIFSILSKEQRKQPSEKADGSISSKQALFLAMSGTVGIGNVIGPVIAITFGGPGALLWFFLTSVIGTGVVYTEIALACKHTREENGQTLLGPMAHMSLLSKKLAFVYSISTIALLLIWNSSQSSVIAKMGAISFGLDVWAVGIFSAITVSIIIYRGISCVTRIMDNMVPLMIVFFISVMSALIISNINNVLDSVLAILKNSFALKACTSGVGTYSFMEASRWGIARGISALEAGVGTSSIPHSLSKPKNYKDQATIAMLGCYVNSIIGLLSGFSIIVTGNYDKCCNGIHGLDPLYNVLYTLHPFFYTILLLSLFMFAFGTIIGNVLSAALCWDYAFGKKYNILFLIISSCFITVGAACSIKSLLEISDLFAIISISMQLGSITYWCYNDPDLF